MKSLNSMELVFLALLIMCQTAYGEVGTATVFLTLSPGTRANGMGQGFVGVADDATAGFYNPGGLALLAHKDSSLFAWPMEVHHMHSPWMPVFGLDDLYLEHSGLIQHIPRIGTFAFSRQFLHIGDVTERDAEGNQIGTFKVFDEAHSMSYSVGLFDRLGVGITVKDIFSQLHPDAIGIQRALDLGLLYRFPDIRLTKQHTTITNPCFGISLSNWGDDISYQSQSTADPLPRLLRIGASAGISPSEYFRLLINVEINKIMVNDDGRFFDELRESKRCIGTEFEYLIPPRPGSDLTKNGNSWAFCFRLGYFYDREAINIPQGLTFGAGTKFGIKYSSRLSPLTVCFDFAAIEPPEDLGDEYTKMYSFSLGL